MDEVTQLPVWAVYVIGFGTPLCALLGVLVGNHLTRRGAVELEARSRREEVMRNLRWASQLAVSGDELTAQLGVAQLRALIVSELLDDEQRAFVKAALDAVVEAPSVEIGRPEVEAEVMELSDYRPQRPRDGPGGVDSEVETSKGDGDG